MRLPSLRCPGLPGGDFGARGRHAIRHVCEDGEPDFDRGPQNVTAGCGVPWGRELGDEGVCLLHKIVLEADRELACLRLLFRHAPTIAKAGRRRIVDVSGPYARDPADTRTPEKAHTVAARRT